MSDGLNNLLRRAGRLNLAVEVGCAALLSAAVLLAAVLMAVLLDAGLALSPRGLAAVDVALAGLAATLVVFVLRGAYANRYDARRTARLLEDRLSIEDSRLINAVELAGNAGVGGSPALRAAAVTQGETLAGQLEAGRAVRWGALRRAALTVALGLCSAGLGYWLMPGLFEAVVPRYLEPSGDHPPFTLLNFEVAVEPGRVVRDRPASITVRIAGPQAPRQANVVFDDGAGRQSLPMLRDAEGRHVLRIDRPRESRRFHIATAGGRSRWFELNVIPVPLFERVTVSYRFPDYTGWRPVEQTLSLAGVRALEETRVSIRVHSNVPLGGGRIALAPAEGAEGQRVGPASVAEMTPTPVDPLVVEGQFVLRFTGHVTLSMTGPDGMPSEDDPRVPMVSVPDAPPRIAITDPGSQVIAPVGWTVPVAITASDDVAVARVTMSHRVNDGPVVTADLPASEERGALVRTTWAFDLAAIRAKAGDAVTYFASAYDNHPTSHSADTPSFTIHVVSQEEYLQHARGAYRAEQISEEFAAFQAELERLRQAREKLLEWLDPLQKRLREGEPLTAGDRQRMQDLQRDLEAFTRESWDLGDRMKRRAEEPRLYEFEQPYLDMLKRLARDQGDLGEKALAVGRALEKVRGDPADAAARLAADQAIDRFGAQDQPEQVEFARQKQRTARDLERLQQAERMLEQAQRMRELAKRQRELADRLGTYLGREQLDDLDRQRSARLAREQDEVRRELAEAVDELDRLGKESAEKLPRMSQSARKIADAIRELGVDADLAESARSALAGEGAAAARAAESAAGKLESLLSDCQAMEGEAPEDLDGALGLPRENLREGLRQLSGSRPRNLPSTTQARQATGDGQGMSGADAPAMVVGPHESSTRSARANRRTGTGHGPGMGPGESPEESRPAQVLNPDSTTQRTQGAASLPGVPVRYRDQAEAYLKRLAEESK